MTEPGTAAGEDRGGTETPQLITTVGQIFQIVSKRAWNSQNLATGAPTRKVRRPKSAAYYDQCIARIYKSEPFIDRFPISELTEEMLFSWQSEFRKFNCAESVNGALIVLRAAFQIALKRGIVSQDPTANLQRADVPERRPCLPTPDQWQAIRRAVAQRQRNPDHVRFMDWLCATGMRPAASRSLIVEDVNLNLKLLRLRGEHAKSRKTRCLPLEGQSLQIATEAAAGKSPMDPLFLVSVRWNNKLLADRSAQFGCHMSHRTFRQMFATRAINAGVPVSLAARLLTHEDGGQTLLVHYVQWQEEALRHSLKRMEQMPTL